MRPVTIDPSGETGPTRSRTMSRHWRTISRGRYVPATVDANAVGQRVVEQAARLGPGGAVTGWAALLLHGAAFFDGREPDGRTRRPVGLLSPDRHLRVDAEATVRRVAAGEVVVRYGVRCVSVEAALADEMSDRDLREAVVAMDMTAAAELTSIRRMRLHARGLPPRRRRHVLAALALASEHSRSPAESRLRLIWVLDAGLPMPLSNRAVFDRDGTLLGVPDLLDVDAGMTGEFDGQDHRTRDRHQRDAERDDAFRRHLLETFSVVGRDLSDRDRVVARILATRARARWVLADQRTWTLDAPPWWPGEQELDERLDLRELRARRAVRRSARG